MKGEVDRQLERLLYRFDKFEEHVDARFDHFEARFEKRFDSPQQSMIITLASFLVA